MPAFSARDVQYDSSLEKTIPDNVRRQLASRSGRRPQRKAAYLVQVEAPIDSVWRVVLDVFNHYQWMGITFDLQPLPARFCIGTEIRGVGSSSPHAYVGAYQADAAERRFCLDFTVSRYDYRLRETGPWQTELSFEQRYYPGGLSFMGRIMKLEYGRHLSSRSDVAYEDELRQRARALQRYLHSLHPIPPGLKDKET